MSTLKVNQIKKKLKELFEVHLDLSDIKPTDSDRENKILSRCLAAFSISYLTGCSEAVAAKSVVDGADDNGIDAIFFDAIDSRLIIAQAKLINRGSGEPEAKDISTFLDGVKDLVEQDLTSFHTRMHKALEDSFEQLMNPGTTINIVTVSTGASKLASHASSKIEKLLKELNGEVTDEVATSTVIGLSEIYSHLANTKGRESVNLELTVENWANVSEPYQAYYGAVEGTTLKAWWSTHGNHLVSENIRDALGNTEVNAQIKLSATTTPDYFWYFNNGITLISDKIRKAPANRSTRSYGVFSLEGASVVNGAQTISTISKISDLDSLAKIRVPIRIISLEGTPEDFAKAVTRSNNLQNRIEGRDFVAHDKEQERLRQEMHMEGIEYRYIRGSDETPSKNSCTLTEVTIALACSTGDSNLAVQVKTGTGRFFSDLTKAPYKTIFNPMTSGAFAFNATLLMREIDKWIKSEIERLPKKNGPKYGILIHGNRIIAAATISKFGRTRLDKPISDFTTALSPNEIEEICLAVYERMQREVQDSFPNKFLGVLFKSPKNSKQIFDSAVL